MDADRLARVTEGQRACLRLVLRHMTSKDIARALAISPHTVDQRIKLAMKTLGAASRVEAARILAALEPAGAGQGLVCQGPDIDPRAAAPSSAPSNGKGTKDGSLRRIGWIAAIAAAAAVGFAALFVGLNALSEFTR
jgi:DNA-binding CsgD family transcriptional regulator